jgi:copper homeostasis protein
LIVRREFELCAETLQACEAAELGGADRIELCAALNEGGVSPSRGFVKAALARVATPIHVLVRPRSGDFVFSNEEFLAMCDDVKDALELGVAGFVVGLLTPEGGVDAERVARLVELAAGRSVTFHRAMDRARNLPQALETVIALGCNRVLTSGGEPTVTEGRDSLERLCAQAAGRIRIAAGGGVTLANAASLLEISGMDLHGSLRSGAATFDGDALWAPSSGGVRTEDVRRMTAMVHAPLAG